MVVVSRRKKLETGVSLQLNNLEDTRSKTGRLFFFFFSWKAFLFFRSNLRILGQKSLPKSLPELDPNFNQEHISSKGGKSFPPQKNPALNTCRWGMSKALFWRPKVVFASKSSKNDQSAEVRTLDGPKLIWVFPKMMVPQKHPKMIIFSRKTHGCWVPPFKETPIWKSLPQSNFIGEKKDDHS